MKARLEQMEAVMRMLLAGQGGKAAGRADVGAARSGGKANKTSKAPLIESESDGELDAGRPAGKTASKKKTAAKKDIAAPPAAGKKQQRSATATSSSSKAGKPTAVAVSATTASGRPTRAAALGARAMAELEHEGARGSRRPGPIDDADASDSGSASEGASDSDDVPLVRRAPNSNKEPAGRRKGQLTKTAASNGAASAGPDDGAATLDMPRRLEELERIEEAVADLETALTGAEGRAGAAGRPDFFAGSDEMARYIGEASVLQKMVAQVRQGKPVV
jgi:hypothetical protein